MTTFWTALIVLGTPTTLGVIVSWFMSASAQAYHQVGLIFMYSAPAEWHVHNLARIQRMALASNIALIVGLLTGIVAAFVVLATGWSFG